MFIGEFSNFCLTFLKNFYILGTARLVLQNIYGK